MSHVLSRQADRGRGETTLAVSIPLDQECAGPGWILLDHNMAVTVRSHLPMPALRRSGLGPGLACKRVLNEEC